jgi:hypothetical protein
VLDLTGYSSVRCAPCGRPSTHTVARVPYCAPCARAQGTRPLPPDLTSLATQSWADLRGALHARHLPVPKTKAAARTQLEAVVHGTEFRSPRERRAAATFSVTELAPRLCAAWDAWWLPGELEEVTHVVLENQMAARMLALQGQCAVYAALRRPSLPVLGMSAVHKLRGLAHSNPEHKTTYAERKRAGLAWCRAWLEEVPTLHDWREWWDTYPDKRDDLADCWLQGIAFLRDRLPPGTLPEPPVSDAWFDPPVRNRPDKRGHGATTSGGRRATKRPTTTATGLPGLEGPPDAPSSAVDSGSPA